MGGRKRVLIVEPEGLYRQLLHIALTREPIFDVVGAFDSADDALQKAPMLKPDAVVLAVAPQAHMNGLRLGLELREHLPTLGVVLLSSTQNTTSFASIPAATSAGWACLCKTSIADLSVLVRAILAVTAGLLVLDPCMVENESTKAGNRTLGSLTPRQREILALIAQGYTNEGIAKKLFLAPKSVENHISQLYRQLDIDTGDPHTQPRVTAVLAYLSNSPV